METEDRNEVSLPKSISKYLKKLEQVEEILKIYTDKLNLPDYVVEEARQIYEEALKKDLLCGRATRNIVAAATYVACRIHNIPRDLKEFEKAYPIVTKKDVARDYRLLLKHLNLKALPINPIIYVNKIASNLNLNQNIIQETIKILNKAEEAGLTRGKDPVGIAAGALYLVCKQNNVDIVLNDIAKTANVTGATIRKRSRDIERLFKGHY